jgi:raffinose/stachyose/melibiose transport system substrate-binding protein
MKTSRFFVLLSLLLAMLLMVACGGGAEEAADSGAADAPAADSGAADAPAEDAEPVTLTVLVHQNPPMVEYMNEFNAQFEAAYPNVTVDMSVVGAGDLSTVTQTRLTANDIDVIDIFGFSNAAQPYMTDVTAPNWQTLIEAGLLLDITDEPFVQNYDEATIRDAGSYNDRVYAVNLGRVSYSGMFVNNDLLAEVGVDTPTTWGELVAACEAVIDAGYECMTVGGGDGWPVFVGSYGLMASVFPDPAALVEGLWTGGITWDGPEAAELWEKYQYYTQNMLEAGVTGLNHDATPARYAAGDVAFMPTGSWQGPAMVAAEPAFDWDYVPFPGSDVAENNQYLYGKYDQGWAIAADSPNREAALNYVAMFSEPENYQAFIDATGFIPTQPTATLAGKLGEDVAPYLDDFRVGYEQYWVAPKGAGQWADGGQGASWFAPFNEWNDAAALAAQAQEDLQAGLDSN